MMATIVASIDNKQHSAIEQHRAMLKTAGYTNSLLSRSAYARLAIEYAQAHDTGFGEFIKEKFAEYANS